MKYITGIQALGIPCSLNTPGKWNVPREYYTDSEKFKLEESEDSNFGDWGIEKNVFVQQRGYTLYNVANHVRAYVDLVDKLDLDNLSNLFAESINDAKARQDIFMLVYGKLRHLAHFDEVNDFMEKEFGNAWYSYVDAVNTMAEKLSKNVEDVIQDVSDNSDKIRLNIIKKRKSLI